MVVVVWNDGAKNPRGLGYGIRIIKKDRDKYFKREWKYVTIKIEGTDTVVTGNIDKMSFWCSSIQIISKELGRWFIANDLAQWPKGKPPKLILDHTGENNFLLRKPNEEEKTA